MTSVLRWILAGALIAAAAQAGADEVAKSTFKNSEGKDVGTLTVNHIASATMFLIKLHDMPPGVHGIHLHSNATCTPPTFDSAGPHWNPTSKQHGKDNPQGPHLGDLGNITIPADGKLEQQFTIEGITLRGEGNLLDGDGSSMVIHAGPDDNKTDPSGNSGARIACASVGLPERNE